jgi:L-ribulokinase
MHGAVAAGAYPDIHAAARRMVRPGGELYTPNPAHRPVYDELYGQYSRLHDFFGRAEDSPMKALRRLRASAFAAAPPPATTPRSGRAAGNGKAKRR